MQFSTPYGTADDQSASYLCGLQEGLSIGAITGGVNSIGGGGGGEELTVNGAIIGYTERIFAATKTYCTKYYPYDAANYGYMAPYGEFKEFIYTALSEIQLDYPIERFENMEHGEYYLTGAKIKLTDNVNMLIYYRQYIAKNDDDLVTIGYSDNTNAIGMLRFALEKDGKFYNTFDATTKYSVQDKKFRLEFSISYYDFDTNKFLWVNDKTVLWPYTDNILYANGTYKNLLDLNMSITIGTYGVPKPSIDNNNPFVMVTPKYCTDGMIQDGSKAARYPYASDLTNDAKIYLENASIVLMCKEDLAGCKVTLWNDDSKYFYIRYDDGIAIIINKGTLG